MKRGVWLQSKLREGHVARRPDRRRTGIICINGAESGSGAPNFGVKLMRLGSRAAYIFASVMASAVAGRYSVLRTSSAQSPCRCGFGARDRPHRAYTKDVSRTKAHSLQTTTCYSSREMSTALNEYLFVDERRVAAYAGQITSSPHVTEKGQEVGLELGITGPKVSLKQPYTTRRRTIHEDVTLVSEFLTESSQMRRGRPHDESPSSKFVLERCVATRVSVPVAATTQKIPAFNFWVSDPRSTESKLGTLVLLEDFAGDDAPPQSFLQLSTYTVLQSLVYFTRGLIERTALNEAFRYTPHPNPYANFDDKAPSLGEFHNVRAHIFEFLTNMEAFVRYWGCLVSTPRNVEVLYRVREYGREAGTTWHTLSVFGYPIWIIAR